MSTLDAAAAALLDAAGGSLSLPEALQLAGALTEHGLTAADIVADAAQLAAALRRADEVLDQVDAAGFASPGQADPDRLDGAVSRVDVMVRLITSAYRKDQPR